MCAVSMEEIIGQKMIWYWEDSLSKYMAKIYAQNKEGLRMDGLNYGETLEIKFKVHIFDNQGVFVLGISTDVLDDNKAPSRVIGKEVLVPIYFNRNANEQYTEIENILANHSQMVIDAIKEVGEKVAALNLHKVFDNKSVFHDYMGNFIKFFTDDWLNDRAGLRANLEKQYLHGLIGVSGETHNAIRSASQVL